MAQEIASLFAKISADSSGLERALKDSGDGLSKVAGTADKLGTAFKAAFALGVAGAAAFTGIVGKTVADAAKMEQGVADIGASMSLTADETAKLGDHILDLGLSPKLKVSATEAAEAVMSLGTAGLSMAQIMGGASEATVLLANSTGLKGGSGFANAASIATDVMAQFNIKAEDMAGAVNQISGVTVASKFDINDYGLAIAAAGGVAGSVGVDFVDFNAILAATSSSFASGSDAGTSLKTFLTTMVPKSNEAKEAMIALGLATEDGTSKFFDAAGQMKSAEEVAALLQGAFGGLSEAQKIEAATTIFGADAMRTAFALADGGTAIITKMKGEIGKVDAEAMAAKRMDTFSGAMEIAWGVIDTLSISIGQKFLPVLRPLIEKFSELAQTYGPMVVEWFGMIATKAGEMINSFLGIVSPVEDGKEAVVTAASGIAAAFANAGTVTAALGAGFEKLGGVLSGNQEVVASLDGAFGDVVQRFWEIVDGIKVMLKPITDAIAKYISFKDVLWGLGIILTASVMPAIVGAIGALVSFLAPIAAVIVAVAGLRWAWENDFGGIKTFTMNALEKITDWFYTESGLWHGTWDKTLSHFAMWAKGGWKNDILIPIQGHLFQMQGAIYAWANGTKVRIEDWFRDAKHNFGVGLSTLVSNFVGWKDDIIRTIVHWADVAGDKISFWFQLRKQDVERFVREWGIKIKDWKDDMIERFEQAFAWFKPGEWLQKGKDIVQGLWNGAKEVWEGFKRWWDGIWGNDVPKTVDVKMKIGSPSKVMEEKGAWTMEGFAKGAMSALPMVTDAMNSLSNVAIGSSDYAYAGASTLPSAAATEDTTLMREQNMLLRQLIAALQAKQMTANVTVAGGGSNITSENEFKLGLRGF